MSNPQAQGSQGPSQQQQGPQLLKADDLAKLRCLNDDQKQKYRPVLLNFWTMMSTKPAGSPEHNQARAKLQEWSSKLIQQEKIFRNKQQQLQQNQQGQSSQPPPPQSGNEQQQPPQPAQVPKQQLPVAQPQPPAQPQQQANRPQGGQTAPNPEIVKHVDAFPYFLPANGPAPGTPEAEAKLREMKNSYLQGLTKQERSSSRAKVLMNNIQQRQQAGQEVPPELISQKQQAEQEYLGAKRYVEEFRKRQSECRNAGGHQIGGTPQKAQGQQQSQPQPQGQAQPSAQAQSQQQPPQRPAQDTIKQEPQIKVEGGQQPPQPAQQFSNMPQGGVPQQAPQNGQVPAPSVAQQAPRPPPAPLSQQQMPPQNQAPFAQPGQQPHQPSRPQINPQQANAHMQQQGNSPHPQSATSNHGGPPVPLSHQAAVSAAQRSYSNQDAQRTNTPMQSGQGNFHAPGSREREQLNNPKLPIPRTLNVTAPAPVAMGQARPTMSGPTNGAAGQMGQPVINKLPPFQLEGEGDRVLSKRKLDELVRQVTGGSEDALTPEVEEAMLSLADEFVDNVITHACKLSKLRESPNLEIRDLQVILERNYNIRIPGYASDEVRTVRKLVPAPGWTQKMNAVQAAKVMGGKMDI